MKMFVELHMREFDRSVKPAMVNINFIEEIVPAKVEDGEFSELLIHGHYVPFHETYDEVRQMIASCQGGMPIHPWVR